jgi:hypothetical protein
MYTVHDAVIDKDKLKVITEKELSLINFKSKDLRKQLDFCNLNKKDLIGKYFDKDGNVIYKVDSQYYMFTLRIEELAEAYNK